MLSQAQQQSKMEKVKKAVDAFLLDDDITIDGVSKNLDISSSAIQRYLNDVEYICAIYGLQAKEKLEKINNKLKRNKEVGKSKGGTISTINNVPTRDENGKFTGNKKR